MVLSKPSTVVIPILYSMSGYVNHGKPCWNIHALNFPGNPVLSMFLIPSATCCSNRLTLLISCKLSSYDFPHTLDRITNYRRNCLTMEFQLELLCNLPLPYDKAPGLSWLELLSSPCRCFLQCCKHLSRLQMCTCCDS